MFKGDGYLREKALFSDFAFKCESSEHNCSSSFVLLLISRSEVTCFHSLQRDQSGNGNLNWALTSPYLSVKCLDCSKKSILAA